MSFGARLKKLRTDKKMSQEALAEILKVSQKTISNYENNERFPDEVTIVKIANFFNVSTDWLFGIVNQSENIINKIVPLYDEAADLLQKANHIALKIVEQIKSGKSLSSLENEITQLQKINQKFKESANEIQNTHNTIKSDHPDLSDYLTFTNKLASLFLSNETPEEIKNDLETFYKYISFKTGDIDGIKYIENIRNTSDKYKKQE